MLVHRLAILGASMLWSIAAFAQAATPPVDSPKTSKPITSNGMPVPVQSDRPVSGSRTSGMNPEQKRQDQPDDTKKSDQLPK